MRHLELVPLLVLGLTACGGSQPAPAAADATQDDLNSDSVAPLEAPSPDASESDSGSINDATHSSPPTSENGQVDDDKFVLQDSDGPKGAFGAAASKIKPSRTEAAMKFIVVDKDKGPIEGVVIALTAPGGEKYHTGETDKSGYAEVLVPVGQEYGIVYLSLGRKDIEKKVTVNDEPNQNIRLTLRYKRFTAESSPPRFVLKGVTFDTGKATIRPESLPQLDGVIEYLMFKKSARIEISGHTDNVGNPNANKTLSANRAKACRDYLVSKGIDGSRIEAVGYGDEQPIAPNDTPEGRQKNRRIEAKEL